MRIQMIKSIFCVAMVALVLPAFCLVTEVQANVLKEKWYMSRGQANMKIKNYKAAIEAFEKLVALDPDNRQAMRLLGRAYELQGLTDKAIEHYDRYLERFPDDADIAFKQARYLEAKRFSYRRKDAIRYYRQGLKQKPDYEKRHRLARLLAEHKETIDEAVTEYRILIKTNPHDADIRAEYRRLLIWDDRYLSDAVKAYEKEDREHPDQFPIQHQLARLYAKDAKYTPKAVKLYGKLVERQPDDVDLRREYAKALAKSDGHFDQATEQFQIVLKEKSDYETRLAYANHLARKESTSDEAKRQYKQLLKTRPRDTSVRLKYARLFGAHLETIDPAIKQYRILIDQNPKNSTAHRELAAAYAWRGDNDRAIYHSRLALKYDSHDKSADRIRDDLMQGREPRITTGLTYLSQSGNGSNYKYSGFILKVGGQVDITPFVTGGAEVGLEKYSNKETSLNGTFYKLSLQGRFDPTRWIDAAWTYHNFSEAEAGSEFLVQYSIQNDSLLITSGIRREFKYDSLLAIAGDKDDVSQKKIGSARSNTAFCKFTHQGERMQTSAMPYLGYVSAESTDNNTLVGAEADARFHLFQAEAFDFSAFSKLEIYHYDADNSGFNDSPDEPLAGGYFSPDFFLNSVLHLKVGYQLSEDSELNLSAGPSFQYTQGDSNGDEWKMGLDLYLSYYRKISPSLHFTAEGSYGQVADVYRRYVLTALLTYTF